MPLKTESLASMCEAVVDCPHSTPVWTDSGFVVLRNQNIKDGRLDLSAPSYTDEEHFKQRVRRMAPRPGDIVITREAPMGEVCKIPDGLTCCLGQRQVLLRPKAGINADYLLYALQSPVVQEQIRWNEGTGSTVSNIRIPVLEKIEIPRLGASEQFIAAALKSVDEKIDLNRRINQTLEAIAQALFQSWFVDFEPVKAQIAARAEGRDPLRAAMSAVSGKADAELDALPPEQYEQLAATAALFPGEMEASELGEIPKGWSHKALLQLTDKIGSGSTPRGGKEVYLEEGVALIRSQNVYDSLFAWDGLARISDEAAAQLKGVTVQGEDVLLNITGASILRTCVVEPDVLPARVNQHVAIIRAKAGVPPRFIHMHLLRPDIKNYLLGLNAGASREAITKAHIESLVLLTPGPELLSAFQTAISPLFRQVHCLTRQMRALGELRDTLLPKLLSGELLVADAIAEAVA